MPAIMIISAFAALVSAGGAPRVSMLMGKGAPDSAERIIGTCTFTLCAISLALTLIMQLFAVPILRLFGASGATLPYALEYISIYSLGTIFVQLSLGLNAFITAQGFSTTSMLTVTIGAALNIVLDPLFIFVFDMGVAGAALATVLSQALSAVFTVLFLLGKKVDVRLSFGGYDKKIPYEPLAPEIVAHVKVLVLMGATAPRIEKAVREDPNFDPQALPTLHADSMQHAVELARGAAKPGDIVSLSPASASFDLYPNFEVRGRDYKRIVNEL